MHILASRPVVGGVQLVQLVEGVVGSRLLPTPSPEPPLLIQLHAQLPNPLGHAASTLRSSHYLYPVRRPRNPPLQTSVWDNCLFLGQFIPTFPQRAACSLHPGMMAFPAYPLSLQLPGPLLCFLIDPGWGNLSL